VELVPADRDVAGRRAAHEHDRRRQAFERQATGKLKRFFPLAAR
jgi:hypothetical protein